MVLSFLLLLVYRWIDIYHFNGGNGLSPGHFLEAIPTLCCTPSQFDDLSWWILQYACIFPGQSGLRLGIWLHYCWWLYDLFGLLHWRRGHSHRILEQVCRRQPRLQSPEIMGPCYCTIYTFSNFPPFHVVVRRLGCPRLPNQGFYLL